MKNTLLFLLVIAAPQSLDAFTSSPVALTQLAPLAALTGRRLIQTAPRLLKLIQETIHKEPAYLHLEELPKHVQAFIKDIDIEPDPANKEFLTDNPQFKRWARQKFQAQRLQDIEDREGFWGLIRCVVYPEDVVLALKDVALFTQYATQQKRQSN